jgi:hypothetical protein
VQLITALYAYPFLNILYFLLASLVSAWTLQTLSSEVKTQYPQQQVILLFMFGVVCEYVCVSGLNKPNVPLFILIHIRSFKLCCCRFTRSSRQLRLLTIMKLLVIIHYNRALGVSPCVSIILIFHTGLSLIFCSCLGNSVHCACRVEVPCLVSILHQLGYCNTS